MGYYPWAKTPAHLAMEAVGMLALTAWGSISPLAGSAAVVALPVLGTVLGPKRGLLLALLGAALPQVALALSHAPAGLMLGAGGYALMVVLPTVWAFSARRDFWQSLLIQWGAMAGASACLLAGLRSLTGPNLFTGGAQLLANYLISGENGDRVLLQAAQMGWAGVTREMAEQQSLSRLFTSLFTSRTTLLPQVRAELAATFQTTLENQLYLKIPGLLVAFIVGGGLLCLCLPVCQMKRRGLETLKMPAFTTWHMPRGLGRWSLALLAGYPMRLFYGGMVEFFLGSMLVSAFQWIYMIQGAALWEYRQKKQGRSQSSRRIFIALAGLVFPFILVIMGLVDQQADPRGLRGSKDNKEDV